MWVNRPLQVQGRSQRGYAPQSTIEWTFFVKNGLCWDVWPALFSKVKLPQIRRKCVGGLGSAPNPAGGTHDAPQPLIGWGRGTHPQYSPWRLRRLDVRLGLSASVAPM